MKIAYRIHNQSIEIIRCFGSDAEVILPSVIDGFPVVRVGDYAFSDRKDGEEADVLIYEENDIFAQEARLLAGSRIEEVTFPDSVEAIGNYIFYGCRELKRLEFSDNLTEIGGGAFNGCVRLACLKVHLKRGNKTCVKEILGELWQRIDVEFSDEAGEKQELSRLVFPQHYEEAVENTPARILFTQHHGSGNNYRQCFYNREMDYRKYDSLFGYAVAQDKTAVITDILFARLLYPVLLNQTSKMCYHEYIKNNLGEIIKYLIDGNDLQRVEYISKEQLWDKENLYAAVEYVARAGSEEMRSFLMNQKNSLIPVQKKKFEL